jgi:hypothetical protein
MPASNGKWTFNNTATTLPDGTYAITATAMNIAGDVSTVSGAFAATIETVAPPAIAGVGMASNQRSLSILGTAPPSDTVQVYLGTKLLGTASANSQGAWGYTYTPGSSTVPAGIYDFSAVAIDSYGNASATSPTFALQVGGPTAGTPQYVAGVLSGQATPGSLVSIVDGDIVIGVVTADASGNWQFTPALAKGSHTIMADAANSSGDTGLLSGAINVTI